MCVDVFVIFGEEFICWGVLGGILKNWVGNFRGSFCSCDIEIC